MILRRIWISGRTASVRVEPLEGARETGVIANQTNEDLVAFRHRETGPVPMSRPEQNQRAAISSTPRASGLVTDREGFRPVALPALAAAVHVSASAAKEAARKIAARRQLSRFQHEDAPLV